MMVAGTGRRIRLSRHWSGGSLATCSQNHHCVAASLQLLGAQYEVRSRPSGAQAAASNRATVRRLRRRTRILRHLLRHRLAKLSM